ncbi:RNA polymerase sigma-70 factor [Chryseolinea lacunae]|uniref:RNA polymerase sigma-70 factor n=1 Tax=Chryseolinea lacunae TaxID=2801331 RepID=A0ABS1KJW3_9BACT|nr:RNA polymerase sigma-70 factor [Chryseolinea lacunae]MBL0739624.1 RNA polymerase sigma-70 factor [Chryseolinea lacunae]
MMMATVPDQDIVRAIRGGDQGAFQQVFHACYEGLCQYACTMLKDMDEAEDVVQALFVKVWEKRADLDIHHSMRSYLFRSVYHQCINQLEHRAIKWKHQEQGALQMLHEVQQPDVFPDELEERVKAAIAALPEQCRIIFVMSRYEEMKYAAIAARLNLSVNTIENQVSKALKILRSKLKDNFV